VLEHDRHLVGYCAPETLRDEDSRIAGRERDVEVVLAGEALVRREAQGVARDALEGIAARG
jgi:hypothetical protein